MINKWDASEFAEGEQGVNVIVYGRHNIQKVSGNCRECPNVAAVGKWTFDVVFVKIVLLCVYSDFIPHYNNPIWSNKF